MKSMILFTISVFLCRPVFADVRNVEIVAKNGTFTPSEIEMKSDEKINLVIRNEGKDAEEFESIPLHKEKMVMPGKSIEFKIGPLPVGKYRFFGDFHPTTATGNLTVK